MKKIILTALVAVVSLAANAQIWAGGSLSMSSNHLNGQDNSTNLFSITPEIGYSISDNLDIAVALSYGHTNDFKSDIEPYSYANGSTVNSFAIKPFVRYTWVKAGNFSAFVDGGLNIASHHANGADDNLNEMGVFVTPGISYGISSKVRLEAHLGDGFTYNHTWLEDDYRYNKVGLNLLNGISFGAYYNF